MSWDALALALIAATGEAFGEAVEYRRGDGVTTVIAPFDLPGSVLTLDDGTRVQVNAPSLSPALGDLPEGRAERGDTWTVGGITYRVQEIIPDGHGAVRLVAEDLSR